ncbi:MAG: hypothetical protein M5U28_04150 [Sandaracinaceae bacterium]|nr:hypothetical protein [Sandaracinaceae bacterium]
MRAHPQLLVIAVTALATAGIVAAAAALSLSPGSAARGGRRERPRRAAPGGVHRVRARLRRLPPLGAARGRGRDDAHRGRRGTHLRLPEPPPARGARRWPVGTVVVKAIESGAPHQWTIHAMVKRGVPFNDDGAIGWEYFELSFREGSGEPSIVWRGSGPPSGHGYAVAGRPAEAGAIPLVCDDCHAPAWQNDSLLTPAIALRR